MSYIGSARNVNFAGLKFPGIVITEPTSEVIEVPSKDPRRAGQMVRIPVQRADIITLRETNPAVGKVRKYLTITSENLRFTTPRFNTVVGLDATKDGEKLTIEQLVELAEQDLAALQTARLAAQAETEVAL